MEDDCGFDPNDPFWEAYRQHTEKEDRVLYAETREPEAITTNEQTEFWLQVAGNLMEKEDPTTAELEKLSRLAVLIERYEAES